MAARPFPRLTYWRICRPSFLCTYNNHLKGDAVATDLEETKIVERQELVEFRKQDAIIAELVEKFSPLKINGLSDKAGYKAVHDARMEVKRVRNLIEKGRKAIKEEALRFGQTVDAEAKRLTALLAPVEAHLTAEEEAVDNEKERIKKAAEDAKRKIVDDRLNALVAVRFAGNPITVADWTEATFQEELAKATAANEERLKVEAEEAERARLEQQRMADERNRLQEIDAQQRAEADRLAAEQRKLELEKARVEGATAAVATMERRQASPVHVPAVLTIQAVAATALASESEWYQARILAVAEQLDGMAFGLPEGFVTGTVGCILSQAADDIRKAVAVGNNAASLLDDM